MHAVDAEVARPHPADDGVEVGAVAIEEGADGMRGFGDFQDLSLEQATGVGIGHHDRGDIGAQLGAEMR